MHTLELSIVKRSQRIYSIEQRKILRKSRKGASNSPFSFAVLVGVKHTEMKIIVIQDFKQEV